MQQDNEKSILFNSEMVKAVLSGRKTQTRRVIKNQPPDPEYKLSKLIDTTGDSRNIGKFRWEREECYNTGQPYFSNPYGQIGDRLWVRETFAIECNIGYQYIYEKPYKPLGPVVRGLDFEGESYFECPRYRASEPDTHLVIEGQEDCEKMTWKPSIHMPRWASRINLEITDIRVERVQDITRSNIRAEGLIPPKELCSDDISPNYKDWYILAWIELWDSINEKRGYGWAVNPWVWVVEFKVI